ncbi:major facilitator superfamily domain-containing protein [Tricladium varicosporioides]|nr:major facilitator superfamily domain-containing protein [Hymenoscyphus varicosporioides]
MGSVSPLHKLKVLVWGESAESALERKLVRKIDFFILTFCCVSYFFNYLDRAAVNNAYVSGMKEELNLKGNDITLLSTILTIGYIIGQVPHALAIHIVPPRVWFPAMIIVWAGLTMCMAACKNFTQMAVCRFFQGLIEASTYAGTQYIIGSWYKPAEIGKRVGLFSACGQAGTMFAGIMMTAVYTSMDGLGGMPGWKWVFVLCGIITMPIAVFGFCFFPDLPETTKAPYLNAAERALAISRLPPKNLEGHKIGWSIIKRTILTKNFWLFVIFWGFGGLLESYAGYTCMLLWMKTAKYTVQQNNQYPLAINGIAIASTLICAMTLDISGKRYPWGLLVCGIQAITAIVLLFWNHLGAGAKFAMFYLAGTSYAIQPIVFTWANIVLGRFDDSAARAVTLYSMNGSSSVFFAFWGVCFYPAVDAKSGYRNGAIAMIAVCVFMSIWMGLIYMQDRKTLKTFNAEHSHLEGVAPEADSVERVDIVLDAKQKALDAKN